MSSFSSSSSQPTNAQFSEVLAKESRWYTFSILLGVPSHDLDPINCSYHLEGTMRCLIEVYKILESSDKIPSWERISQSLRKMSNHKLANKIHSEFIVPRLSPASADQDTDPGMSDWDVSPVREDLRRSKSDSDLSVVVGSSETERSVVKAVTREFDTLFKRFSLLVAEIKEAFRKSKVKIGIMQDLIKGLCNLKPLKHDEATIDSILDRLDPHYSILNFDTLRVLVDNFLKRNQMLRKKMKDYEEEIEKFKSFAKMEHLVDIIKTKRSSRSNHKTMKLKVREFWGKVTMKKFEEVMNEILETLHEGVSHVSVDKGCLCVSWIVPDTHTSQPLTHVSELLRIIGVISLHIGDEEIFRTQEEGCEVMEAAMLQAIELKNTRAIELLLTLGCDPEVATRNGELAVTTIVNIKESDEAHERGSTMKQVCVFGQDENVEAIIREKMFTNLLKENADLKRRLAETVAGESDCKRTVSKLDDKFVREDSAKHMEKAQELLEDDQDKTEVAEPPLKRWKIEEEIEGKDSALLYYNRKQWVTPPVHVKPTVQELNEQLEDLVYWERFAIHLPKITQKDIDIIKRDNPNSISDQKNALFDRWLRMYSSASWDEVVLALEIIGESHLAKKILHVAHKKELKLKVKSEEVTIQEWIVLKLSELHRSFSLLSFEFVKALREKIESGSIPLSDVVLRAKQELPFYDIKELNEAKSIDHFIDIISPHYHFLNIHLLLVLVEQFINPSELLHQLHIHEQEVGELKTSSKIRRLYNALSPYVNKPQHDTFIIVKVQNAWEERKLRLVECLLQMLFRLEDMDIHNLFRVIPG